jgi:hypothetical protein
MADIELVIKIPEEDWEFLKESDGCRFSRIIIESVINGTPLPKGHGDLIDREELLKLPIDKANYPSNYVKYAQTIIEKDKEA